jgi:hypothetical protein
MPYDPKTKKWVYKDIPDRIWNLIDELEPELQGAFLDTVSAIQNEIDAGKGPFGVNLMALLAEGRFDEVTEIIERAGESLAAQMTTAYIESAQSAAKALSEATRLDVSFDQVNEGALNAIRQNSLDKVKGFTEEQTKVVKSILENGVENGTNPREVARDLRQSIGLTENQWNAVSNYRNSLEAGTSDALDRALRDKRFDSTVQRAIDTETPLTTEQIDQMVERYANRMLAYRAEVIARTESLRAAHEGSEAIYQQAIDKGDLDPKQIVREWNTAGDTRVRDSHEAMQGQERPFGEPFESGEGNLIRYPCDPDAPASDSIQCRCAVGTRIYFDLPQFETAAAQTTGVISEASDEEQE